eukprot:m.337598 g.337598  ORF g.337598 m.337598 type:complete len:231 (-) comp20554_c0_seq1:1410-2102(-)
MSLDEGSIDYAPTFRAIINELKSKSMAKHFAHLPSREDHPGYFESVKSPLSLEDMSSKNDSQKYKTVSHLRKDVELICENAKLYSGEGSAVDLAAIALRDAFEQAIKSSVVLGSHEKKAKTTSQHEESSATKDEQVAKKRKLENNDDKTNDDENDDGNDDEGNEDDDDNDDDEDAPADATTKKRDKIHIASLHRTHTHGSASVSIDRQDCSLAWLRRLMGYKDREFTEQR